MGSIWTIAQHAVREALRMRIVLAFVVLILALILGMPLAVQRPDAPVSSMVQTFLAWTLMPLGVILTLLAMFLGCLSISDELIHRQIYLLVSKPVSRWKYVVGKWLGVVWVLSGLMAFSAVVIFGVTRFMAARATADPLDPLTLRHEVLTARASSKLQVPDITAQVERAFQRLVEQGRYTDPNRLASDRAKLEISTEMLARFRTVPPGEYRVYEFRDIVLPAGVRDLQDVVVLDVPQVQSEVVLRVLAEFTGSDKSARALLEQLPATVAVRLPSERARALGEQLLRAGARGRDAPGFLMQLRYKARGMGYLPDETLITAWYFGPDPQRAAQNPPELRKDVMDRYHVVSFPASAVSDNGRVYAIVANNEHRRQDRASGHPGASIAFEGGGMEVLYAIGTFEGNFLRTLFLMWCRVVLIAGVAVCAATFLSFPVACLVVFLFYILAVSGEYVSSALEFGSQGGGAMGQAQHLVQPLLEACFWIMPKFAEYDGVEVFVDGRNVSLVWDLMAFSKLVLLLTTTFLLLACIIFQRRQVAELSV